MVLKYKPVKFYYYSVAAYDQNDEEVDCKLNIMFDNINSEYAQDEYRYVFELENEKYKLDRVENDSKEQELYHIIIEKLRDYNWPSKSKFEGESEELIFEEQHKGEDIYLGEKISLIYDSDLNIFMIQVNRNSISLEKVEIFLNAVLSERNEPYTLDLTLMVQKNPKRKIRSFMGVKVIETRITNEFNQQKDFEDIFDKLFGKEDSSQFSQKYNLELKITAKRDAQGREYLPTTLVDNVLAIKPDSTTEKLRVRGKNLSGKTIPVDLINDKITSEIKFEYKRDTTLNHEIVYSRMKVEYFGEIKGILKEFS